MPAPLRARPLWRALPALLLAGAACGPSGEPPAERAQDELVLRMGDHAAVADAARAALIRGELAPAQAAGTTLARSIAEAPLPAALAAHQSAAGAAAQALAGAPDLEQAALAFGALGAACGGCHRASGRSPTLPPVDLSAGTTLAARMQLHDRAAAAVWAGLVLDDPDRLRAASRALQDAPLLPGAGAADTAPLPPEVRSLEIQVHDAAAAAARAADPAARGRACGKMLAACASCHHRLSAGPDH